jgi:L-seryl-tRNA(Ser) seleniumtransferase
MAPEVLQAMVDSASCYVDMHELNRRAGEVVARHTGAEAGLVTAGAAASMLLQAAACMTGTDPAKIARIPDTTGMKNELVIHRSHRMGYDQAYIVAGAKLVEVGKGRSVKPWELEAAISDKTAGVIHICRGWRFGNLELPEVVEIAHSHGVPVIVDASGVTPPLENLTKFVSQGADMVGFSGGKGLEGPQSTGILCGRSDLIEAARLNNSPNAGVGRPSKVCKEEIVGLITALERFVNLDHEARWAKWRAMSETIVDALHEVPGLTMRVEEDSPIRQGPQAVVYFNSDWRGPSSTEIQQSLIEGDPPIAVGQGGYGDELYVATVTLQEGEEHIVARRLREELTARD